MKTVKHEDPALQNLIVLVTCVRHGVRVTFAEKRSWKTWTLLTVAVGNYYFIIIYIFECETIIKLPIIYLTDTLLFCCVRTLLKLKYIMTLPWKSILCIFWTLYWCIFNDIIFEKYNMDICWHFWEIYYVYLIICTL